MKAFLKLHHPTEGFLKVFKENVFEIRSEIAIFKFDGLMITFPLDNENYSKLLRLICSEENETIGFAEAVNAVKSGSHQIEKDCDKLDLLKSICFECLLSLDHIKSNIKYICHEPGIIWYREDPIKDVPIIKLSQIQPKDENKNDGFISVIKNSEIKKVNKLNKALQKSVKLAKDLDAILNPVATSNGDEQVQFSFDAPVAKEEKAVELEKGKWYKRIPKSHSEYILFCFQELGSYKNYGFDTRGVWSSDLGVYEDSIGIITVTTEEVTEALTKEAVKRGLIEGVYVNGASEDPRSKGCLLNGRTEYIEDQNALFGSVDQKYWDTNNSNPSLFKDGIWATPIKTLTKQQAEEKLGNEYKIID